MNYHQPHTQSIFGGLQSNQSLILHIQGINPLEKYEDSRVDVIFDDGSLRYQSYRAEYKEGNFLLTPTNEIEKLSPLVER